jgi:Pentapeptide repeats (8 copies)
MADDDHLAQLMKGVAAWNAWRDENSNVQRPNLNGANLAGANLRAADFTKAILRWADLENAILVETILRNADLTGCHIYGISAWSLKLEGTKQQDLVITQRNEPEITVDNIEVAQFVYLLLHNEKIRNVIDTIGKKGVLLLGRFTEGRIEILERLREKLRSLGFVPMVFNFDKPKTKDFTETVRLLANLSHFVIVDITNPRSAPLELQATVPDYMIPFVPILEKGQKPFAMFVDLQNKYDWVVKPVIVYPSIDRLIGVLEDKIVRRAEAKFNQLVKRRTRQLRVENI